MILHAQIESERGKPAEKTGNEYIRIEATENRENNYSISLHPKHGIRIHDYSTGKCILDQHYCETCKKFYGNDEEIDPCDIPF